MAAAAAESDVVSAAKAARVSAPPENSWVNMQILLFPDTSDLCNGT